MFLNKTVLITGGTKGIGKGIAESFLSESADVIVCGRNKPKLLPNFKEKYSEYIECDVKEPDQIRDLIEKIQKKYNSIDVLVNNAGGGPPVEAANASPRLSKSIIELNLLAPIFVSTEVNNIMQQQALGGCIINISSVSVIRPSPGAAAYGSAKSGLANLTESLAIEWAPKVRLNSILCGLVETEESILHYGSQESITKIAETIPLKRMGKPKDIGNGCIFLASSQAEYISGASLLIHGGGESPSYNDAKK